MRIYHRKERIDGESPEVSKSSSVDDGDGHSSKRQEGDGQVHRHEEADDEDGEEGEPDADEHVVDHDAHHVVHRAPSFLPQQPDKDFAIKALVAGFR